MRPIGLTNVFEDRGLLWTQNRVPGQAVYGERLRQRGKVEYRDWNPFRSKLAALARKDPRTAWPGSKDDVLYLGAASGTTVSHVSDITDGLVYAVEFSPRSVRDLLWNMEARDNVVPILEDARHPERYAAYLDRPADFLIQDVAQRDQVGLFVRNAALLKKGGRGILVVKARSMDVAASLNDIYARVAKELAKAGLPVQTQVDLEPFEKDHRAFVVVRP